MPKQIYILTFNHLDDTVDEIEFRTQEEAEEALKLYEKDKDIYSSIVLSEYDYEWNAERIIHAKTLTA